MYPAVFMYFYLMQFSCCLTLKSNGIESHRIEMLLKIISKFEDITFLFTFRLFKHKRSFKVFVNVYDIYDVNINVYKYTQKYIDIQKLYIRRLYVLCPKVAQNTHILCMYSKR